MQVTTIQEHTDGSATIMFDMNKEEHDALLSYGILEALKAGIRAGEKLTCEGENIDEG
jgi:hypothetical protein